MIVVSYLFSKMNCSAMYSKFTTDEIIVTTFETEKFFPLGVKNVRARFNTHEMYFIAAVLVISILESTTNNIHTPKISTHGLEDISERSFVTRTFPRIF